MASNDQNGTAWSFQRPDISSDPLPTTKGFKVCNGFYPFEGHVWDNMHAWGGFHTAPGPLSMKVVDGKIVAMKGGASLNNMHFQGGSKNEAKARLVDLLGLKLRKASLGTR